ncbi:MAG: DUF3052 domain-containing protein [Actinomycetia bacterium]|nr:DUF3052 domain-containing protein [Actinomycetes bacterium]
MGFKPAMVVQELGWDQDADPDLREAVEEIIGADLAEEDCDDVVEGVLLWFREYDGDLVDILVDAIAPLAGNGFIWLLTPKRGRDGHVEPSEIAESAPIAGLSQTSMISVGPDWSGARLVARKSRGDRQPPRR